VALSPWRKDKALGFNDLRGRWTGMNREPVLGTAFPGNLGLLSWRFLLYTRFVVVIFLAYE